MYAHQYVFFSCGIFVPQASSNCLSEMISHADKLFTVRACSCYVIEYSLECKVQCHGAQQVSQMALYHAVFRESEGACMREVERARETGRGRRGGGRGERKRERESASGGGQRHKERIKILM